MAASKAKDEKYLADVANHLTKRVGEKKALEYVNSSYGQRELFSLRASKHTPKSAADFVWDFDPRFKKTVNRFDVRYDTSWGSGREPLMSAQSVEDARQDVLSRHPDATNIRIRPLQ